MTADKNPLRSSYHITITLYLYFNFIFIVLLPEAQRVIHEPIFLDKNLVKNWFGYILEIKIFN